MDKHTIIKKNTFPQRKHCKFIDDSISELEDVYDYITEKIIQDIILYLKYDEEILTKTIKQIKIDLSFIGDRINTYLLSIKYALLGKAALTEAEINKLKELKIFNKVNELISTPGLIQSSFLHSIDTQKQYFQQLNISNPPITNYTIKNTLEYINTNSGNYIDTSLLKLKNSLITSLQNVVNEHNTNNFNNIHASVNDEIMKLEQEKEAIINKQTIVKEAIKNVFENKISVGKTKQAMRDVISDYSVDYDRIINTELGLASSIGTLESIKTIFKDDPELKIAIVNIRDSRCCDACEKFSRDESGNLKIYRLSELALPGSNINKKKNEWKPSIPLVHINCRCAALYIPPGFSVDKDGHLIKKA